MIFFHFFLLTPPNFYSKPSLTEIENCFRQTQWVCTHWNSLRKRFNLTAKETLIFCYYMELSAQWKITYGMAPGITDRFDWQKLKVWMRELETKYWCFQLLHPGALLTARNNIWPLLPLLAIGVQVILGDKAALSCLFWGAMERKAVQLIPISQKHRISMNFFCSNPLDWELTSAF